MGSIVSLVISVTFAIAMLIILGLTIRQYREWTVIEKKLKEELKKKFDQ